MSKHCAYCGRFSNDGKPCIGCGGSRPMCAHSLLSRIAVRLHSAIHRRDHTEECARRDRWCGLCVGDYDAQDGKTSQRKDGVDPCELRSATASTTRTASRPWDITARS